MPRPRNPGLPPEANAADNPTPRGYIKLRDIGPVRVFVERLTAQITTNYRGDLRFYGDMSEVEQYARTQDPKGWTRAFVVIPHSGLVDYREVEVKALDPQARNWIDRATGQMYVYRQIVPDTPGVRAQLTEMAAELEELARQRDELRARWQRFATEAPLRIGPGGRAAPPDDEA